MSSLAFLALLLPGLAWYAWLGRRKQDPLIALAQVIGISLALIALLAQLFFLLSWALSASGILLLLTGFAALALVGWIRRPPKITRRNMLILALGLLLLGGLIALRLYQARQLVLPNWVDSQHHYLILRVILEKGGLPETLDPYLSMPFYYHYGYHSAAALFTFLSHRPIGEAMLIFGQVLNALVSLSVYALGKTLFRDWRPAAAAALLTGFVTRMPAYYLSWGRYTLTVGILLLPLAVGLALRLTQKTAQRGEMLTFALLTAGVLLSHYFTAILLAIYLVILAFAYLIPHWKAPLTALLDFAQVPGGAGLGLLLAAPWLLRVAKYSSASARLDLPAPNSLETVFASDRWGYISNLLGPTSNHALLVAAGIGVIIALVLPKSRPRAPWRALFALWSLWLGVMSLPIGLRLRPFRADHFTIILFLPVALWAGWLFWRAGRCLGRCLKKRWLAALIPALLVLGWSAWSVPLSADIVNSVTVLTTEDDLAALEWVKENTPPDARFFINTSHWLNHIYRGVDGGGWLLPYAGRWALVPTVFYTFSPDRAIRQELREWGARAAKISTCSEDFWALVSEADLGWIYLREDVGAMQPENLERCAGITEIYANKGVHIYTLE